MRRFQFSFLLFVVITLAACQSKQSNQIKKNSVLQCHLKLSPQELSEDFSILTTSLKELHPDLFRVNSKETIDSSIANIQKKLSDSLSYLEFLKLVAPLLTDIGCINTQWGHSKDYVQFRNENTPIFPLKFEIKDERFYISDNFTKDTSISIGEEIISINTVSSKEYLAKNYPILPIDGEVRSLQWRWLESYFPNHHSNFWEQVDTFLLQIRNEEAARQVKVPALLKKDFKAKKKSDEPPLTLEFIDSIGILKISSFNNNIINHYGQDFNAFIDSSFKEIRDKDIKVLVLDIRDNSWGDFTNSLALYSYLSGEKFKYVEAVLGPTENEASYPSMITAIESLSKKDRNRLTAERLPNENSFKGELFVITNGWNINVGGYFSSKLKDRPNTFFVGEKSGSNTFGMNTILQHLSLPHSGINFYIPTVQFIADAEKIDNIDGKEIDIKIEHPYLENTIQYIKEK